MDLIRIKVLLELLELINLLHFFVHLIDLYLYVSRFLFMRQSLNVLLSSFLMMTSFLHHLLVLFFLFNLLKIILSLERLFDFLFWVIKQMWRGVHIIIIENERGVKVLLLQWAVKLRILLERAGNVLVVLGVHVFGQRLAIVRLDVSQIGIAHYSGLILEVLLGNLLFFIFSTIPLTVFSLFTPAIIILFRIFKSLFLILNVL